MSTFEDRIKNLGITLPEPPKSVANYVPAKIAGSILTISGQLCLDASGQLVAKGVVGKEVSVEEAIAAARASSINILAQARAALGSLERVKSVIRLGGFIASSADFAQHALIMNGASNLMVEVFGEAGRHARSTVGVASLPLQATVEVEAQFEIV